MPASEVLLAELCAQHPPASAEGRAALVAAARPYFAQMTAPVLVALLRRRLAELTGLPETELRDLLRPAVSSERNRGADPATPHDLGHRQALRPPKPGRRRAPSLVRELIQALLLQPELARSSELPQTNDGSLESAAFGALVDHCTNSRQTLTTAGIMQHFAETPHEPVLASALATAEDHGITPEHAAEHLKAGAARYWQQAQRAGHPVSASLDALTSEETERLRQLELVRRTLPAPPEGSVLGGKAGHDGRISK